MLLAAIVAVSQALVLPNGQVITSGPVVAGVGVAGVRVAAPVVAKVATDDYDPNPQYSYSYEINVSTVRMITANRADALDSLVSSQ